MRRKLLFVVLSVVFLLVCAVWVRSQDQPPAQASEKPKVDRSLVYNAEKPPSPEVFLLNDYAKKFQFGKVDNELLRQVDALDKYIDDHGWVVDDPVVTGYVNRIGRSVVPPDAPENVKWKFYVLRDPEPNAFALPNGSIYIHSGLLSRLQNEAQMAGVLAHESTHVFNRHTYAGYHDMRKKIVAIEVLQAGATAAWAAGASYQIVDVIGNLVPMALVETIFGYRREMEHEADAYAVSVMRNAGYDPSEMPKALDLLRKGPEVDLSEESYFWADHPRLQNRVNDTEALAKHEGLPPGGGKINETEFILSTKKAAHHDAGLAMTLGKPRTAVYIAQRLIALEPENGENFALLGDAYRALGARTPVPDPIEYTNDSKKKTRKMMRKMTQQEYEKALMEAPGGSDQWKKNCEEAEKAYLRALELTPESASARRGLGFLYEVQGNKEEALQYFQKYLAMAPQAKDARQIKAHIEKLQKPASEVGK